MNVGTQKPNQFDRDLEDSIKEATAEQALAAIAKQPRIVKAVKDALAAHDSRGGKPGPSRTQTVRKALAEVIQADD